MPVSSPICFLTTGWKSCHKLPACVCIAAWENGWEGHVLLVMCSDIISIKQDVLTSDIHVWLQCACGDTCIGASNVRWWINLFKDRNTDITGRLTASAEGDKGKLDLIRENWCMPVTKMAAEIQIRHHVIQVVVGSLVYQEVRAFWVPCLVTEEHKLRLKRFSHNCWNILLLKAAIFFTALWHVVKAGFITLIKKQNQRAWNVITHRPRTQSWKQFHQPTRQWELPFGMLVNFFPQVECYNATCYLQMRQKLHHALRDKHPEKIMTILQNENTWLLIAYLCKEGIRKKRWKLLPHQQPYTPDQAPLNYHLFGFIKYQMRGQRYAMNEAVQKATHAVCEQLKWCFTTKGSSRTVAKNASIRMEDFAEKWLQCTDFTTVVFFYL